MATNDPILLALFDNHKRMLVHEMLRSAPDYTYQPAFVWAVVKGIAPAIQLSHPDEQQAVDPFRDCYKYSYEDVQEAINYLDDMYMSDDKDSIEHVGDLYSRINLHGESIEGFVDEDMVSLVARYAYLSGHFSDGDFWEAFAGPGRHRSATGDIMNKFDINEITFYGMNYI